MRRVALALLLALTACGVSQPEPNKLTVWSFLPSNYNNGQVAYERLVAEFEKLHPGVDVELVDVPYSTYFDQVRNASVAQQGPDVVTMYPGATAAGFPDAFVPLQNQINLNGLRFVDISASRDGNLYAVPAGEYGYSLLVNDDLLRKAGLDPSTALSTWDGLLTTCKALEAKGIEPFSTDWQDGFQYETLLYMIVSQILTHDQLQNWKADDPAVEQATERILELRDHGCFPEDSHGRRMFFDAFGHFYEGKGALFTNLTLSSAETAAEEIENVSMVPLPQVPESTHTKMIDSGPEAGWAITEWTDAPEAAKAFVEFIVSAPAQKILWTEAGVPPNRSDVTVKASTPMQEKLLDLLRSPENQTAYLGFSQAMLAVMERNAVPLIEGSMPAKAFLREAAATTERPVAR